MLSNRPSPFFVLGCLGNLLIQALFKSVVVNLRLTVNERSIKPQQSPQLSWFLLMSLTIALPDLTLLSSGTK